MQLLYLDCIFFPSQLGMEKSRPRMDISGLTCVSDAFEELWYDNIRETPVVKHLLSDTVWSSLLDRNTHMTYRPTAYSHQCLDVLVVSPSPHPPTVTADSCPSLSLVLPKVTSCSKGVFSSQCCQVLAHKGSFDWWGCYLLLYIAIYNALKLMFELHFNWNELKKLNLMHGQFHLNSSQF